MPQEAAVPDGICGKETCQGISVIVGITIGSVARFELFNLFDILQTTDALTSLYPYFVPSYDMGEGHGSPVG